MASKSIQSKEQKKEHLYTNHFICSFANDISLYQYDVIIEELGSKSNDWYAIKDRSRCSSVMQSFIHKHQFKKNVFVWYDEQKCLYSTSILPTPQIKLSEDGQHRFQITASTNSWSTSDINHYISGQSKNYPHDVIRILETLLKRSIQDRIKIVKNKCYFLDESSKKLNNGFETRRGFVQALNLAPNNLTLNIQTKLTTFYSSISLLDFIHQQIGEIRIPSDNERKTLNKILRNCLIVTRQSNWKQVYEFEQFDCRPPGDIYIESGDSLTDYYQKEYNTILVKSEYPCIEVYSQGNNNKPCHLPVELCRIKEWQIYDEPTPESTKKGGNIPTPDMRYHEIIAMLDKCDYNSNILCHALGFKIPNLSMLELDARVLKQSKIQSSHNSQIHSNGGRIPLNGHLFQPEPISKLAITCFGTDYTKNEVTVNKFSSALYHYMQSLNIHINEIKYPKNNVIDNDMKKIDDYFRQIKEQQYQFLVCIINTKHNDDLTILKAMIKRCGTLKYGIMTQCAVLSEILKNDRSFETYCMNLIRKINFKNGGINTKVDLDIILRNKRFDQDSFMFFGADVIHPTNVTRQHPSIATIVGSGDQSCSRTAVRVCKQYPKQGKCSIETIVGMTEMVEQLLVYNRQLNGVLPTKIVFYRDGVDNGQFQKIRNYEIPAIRRAFDKIYGDENTKPDLTFIIVQKRHNTRFFTYNPQANQSQAQCFAKRKGPRETDNMSIGTVIDTAIVNTDPYNFYLNSHHAYQGVNHPSHYHVLLNEINFTADELQSLTFHLCFTDSRSSAAEAIPSVVHQADIAALKARDLFYTDDDNSLIMDVDRRNRFLRNGSSDDLEFEVLNFHEDLKNLPVLG